MSSSETEEFFDALDVTPLKDKEQNKAQHGGFDEGGLGDIDEEKTLLETKKLVEIRKLEDAALEKRLHLIQAGKEKERQENLQHETLEKNASTNVKRRKKLEEMRQMIGADHTPDRPNKRSTEQTLGSNSIDEHLAGRDESSGIEVKDNLLNSQIENDLSTERQECSSRSDNTQPIHEKASSYNAGSDRIISKSLVSNPHSSLGTDCVVNQLGAVTEHLNQVEISDIQEPDLIQSVKSSSLGRNKSPLTLVENLDDEIVLRAAGTARGGVVRADSPGLLEGKNYPTIHGSGESAICMNVGSEDGFTEENSKDFKDMPPPPLVPPRRKKKATSVGSLDEVSTTTSPEPGAIKPQRPTTSPPNQLSLPSPGMSGCLLTAPSPQVARKTLNINEAAMGNKVVTAAEGENTRAVNDITIAGGDTESIWDNESIMESQISISSSIESPLNTSGNKAVTAENKSHSFPRGQQRPVSEVSLTPTQMAILDDVSVVNLDTGERIPIKVAEEKIPQCMNPLSLHIMRRTKEYLSDSSLNKHQQAEGDVIKEEVGVDNNIKTVKELGKKRKKLKTLFGKAKTKLKSVKDEVFHNTESNSSSEDEDGDRRLIQVKASKSNKGPLDFDLIVPVQYMEAAHTGAVWTMKFSPCGRLLASGGTDNLLKVWVLKDAYAFFDDMRLKYSEEQKKKMSPAVSEDSLDNSSGGYSEASFQSQEEEWFSPFNRKPFCTYKGHTADILDVSWSKNYFILTSSMDKTVRLWHVSRKECLCCFQHIDFVTAIAFHPKDDRYFLSGSLDGKLRLWNIPDRKVELWNEVNGSTKLITATNFCMKGKFAVAGTYDGRCVFYSTEQLKYYTQIHVRSTRGKNSKGRKITGVEPMPGEDKILVTSNDSRVRIYDLRDLTLTCKYKGCANNSSQIKANFSHDGRFIVCGSEDHFVYIWRTQHEFHKFSSARRDRSDYWESIKAHSAVVTVALFAPKPNLVIKNQFEYLDSDDKQSTPEVRGEVLISADYNGTIKCFINKFKPVNA